MCFGIIEVLDWMIIHTCCVAIGVLRCCTESAWLPCHILGCLVISIIDQVLPDSLVLNVSIFGFQMYESLVS